MIPAHSATTQPQRDRRNSFQSNLDFLVCRAVVATACLMWSIALGSPGDTFQRPFYRNMSMVADEDVWALVFGMLALIGYCRLFWRLPRQLMVVTNFTQMFLLFYVSLSLTIDTYPLSGASMGQFAVALLAGYIFVRPSTRGCAP